jgi:hypothetical protein
VQIVTECLAQHLEIIAHLVEQGFEIKGSDAFLRIVTRKGERGF